MILVSQLSVFYYTNISLVFTPQGHNYKLYYELNILNSVEQTQVIPISISVLMWMSWMQCSFTAETYFGDWHLSIFTFTTNSTNWFVLKTIERWHQLLLQIPAANPCSKVWAMPLSGLRWIDVWENKPVRRLSNVNWNLNTSMGSTSIFNLCRLKGITMLYQYINIM